MKPLNKNVTKTKFQKVSSHIPNVDLACKKNSVIENMTLEWLESPFPVNVEKIFQDVIKKGDYKKGISRGTEELRKEISIYESKKYGLKYKPHNEIIVMPHDSYLSFVSLGVLINPGDEVIVSVPGLIMYEQQIEMFGGKVIRVKTDKNNEFKLTAEEINKVASKNTKAVILQPTNPGMSVYTKKELTEIAEVCKKKDLFIISDERYDIYTYDDKFISPATIKGLEKKTIVLKSFATKIPMRDFSFGYIMTYGDIADQINKFAINTYENVPILFQKIAIEAMRKRGFFDFIREKIRQKRDLFVRGLEDNKYFKLDYQPKAGNCLLLNCSSLIKGKSFKNTYELADFFIKNKKVYLGVVPSSYYGMENYIVIYYSSVDPKKINDICKRLYGNKAEDSD